MRILWIDDDPGMIDAWIRYVEKMGNVVVQRTSVVDGVREYNRTHFECIILDRDVPTGLDPLPTFQDFSVEPAYRYAGERILIDLRGRFNLARTPIVFFTQVDAEQLEARLCPTDERVRVVSKDERPDKLYRVMHDLCREYPADPGGAFDIRVTDHYEIAPYMVTNRNTGKREPIEFLRPSRRQPSVDLADFIIADYLVESVQRDPSCVEFAYCADRSNCDSPLGIYHRVGQQVDEPIAPQIVFESAPEFCFSETSRRFAGVGKACVARYIREYLGHRIYSREPVIVSTWLFEQRYPPKDGPCAIREFLGRLGFEPIEIPELAPSGYAMALSYDRAREFLESVSQ